LIGQTEFNIACFCNVEIKDKAYYQSIENVLLSWNIAKLKLKNLTQVTPELKENKCIDKG
jgi:hypothetical protein